MSKSFTAAVFDVPARAAHCPDSHCPHTPVVLRVWLGPAKGYRNRRLSAADARQLAADLVAAAASAERAVYPPPPSAPTPRAAQSDDGSQEYHG